MNDVLIVGFGNTVRGDDGLGPLVTGSLEDGQMPPCAHARIAYRPQLDVSLVAELHEVDLAIFVDARQDEDDALIRVANIEPQKDSLQSPILSHSTHSMAISVLLSIVSKWYGRQPSCYLVQPKGFDFSFRETISEKANMAATLARQAIYQILWAHCHGDGDEVMEVNSPLCVIPEMAPSEQEL